MRRASFTLLGLLAGACGTQVTGVAALTDEAGAPGGSVQDASIDGADSAPEQASATIACGSDTCTTGTQVCCQILRYFYCADVAKGCYGQSPGHDAGTQTDAVRLDCTTYNNCSDHDDCCYDPAKGSSCRSSCSESEQKLCTLNKDDCGSDYSCKTMSDPPASTVGACKKSD